MEALGPHSLQETRALWLPSSRSSRPLSEAALLLDTCSLLLLYVLYVLYLTRQPTEHPLSPSSLLYVLYVLYILYARNLYRGGVDVQWVVL